MKTFYPLIVIVLLIAFISVLPAEACWIALSAEELVEQSDLIVIGEIKGIIGTEQVKGAWTCWHVEAQYFLKGSLDSPELIVATPGSEAEHKQPVISAQYRLDTWGNTVLLFLMIGDGYLQPLTPQGVVALKQNESLIHNNLTGEHLVQRYNIDDEKTSEEMKKEIENYIMGLLRVIPATTGIPSGPTPALAADQPTPPAHSAAGAGGGLIATRYILLVVLMLLALLRLIMYFRRKIKKVSG